MRDAVLCEPVRTPILRGSSPVRSDTTTPESLAALRPVLVGQDPEATVTAGNGSGRRLRAGLRMIRFLAICAVTQRASDEGAR